MYTIQHLHFHDNPVAAAFRGMVRFAQGSVQFVYGLFLSFAKARAVANLSARYPHNQEAIKRIMLED